MGTGLDRRIMHFTHVKNLRGVVEFGLQADNQVIADGRAVVQCADQGIKASRRDIPITVTPGGVVADYVPFYFAQRSPMMYVISRGSVAGYTEGLDPLIYLVTTIRAVEEAGLQWVGSDGNCAASLTSHFNNIDELEAAVDWPLMKTRIWKNVQDDGDRMRRRAAELLVHGTVPFSCIQGIVTRNENLANQIRTFLGSSTPIVKAIPDWYY
ncbi:DUF4433 domain-containing protein [Cryptosporangium sp. NPDC051539]|uniref:type II toxin-antitoxin system toxin DNA ADP-ribosyl transferase DarT n=1 Tax=Cryptosporangium sp. NPDC051539 TaxID=3363962 RepID=UPI0037A99BAD